MPSEKRERQRAARIARREAELAAQRRAAKRRQIILTIVTIGGIVGLLFLFGILGGDDGEEENVATENSTTTSQPGDESTTTTEPTAVSVPPGATVTGDTKCPAADGSSERTTTFEKPPPMCINARKTYRAKVETDVGEFVIQLDAKNTPKTANNFVVLARYHFYDGIVFHRVIQDFMIQGGDPTGTGSGGPGYKFEDENLSETTYAEADVAMANSGANTQGSQFFVIVSENGAKQLQPNYTKFGKVVEGFDVIKKIEADADPAAPNGSPPKVTHRIIKVTIEEN